MDWSVAAYSIAENNIEILISHGYFMHAVTATATLSAAPVEFCK